ncbi:MAG: hypothetical protein WCE44_12315 [Candidatus Velthaea sp.]|jgi:hypothetical protein
MRLFRRLALGCALLVSLGTIASADTGPTFTGPLSLPEKQFVAVIQVDLRQRFPHAADAERAGYVRYTNEDDSGAISYANKQWNSTDAQHPSQLWYDVNGNLLGADFSVLKTSAARPSLWGIDPGRWAEFDAHVHYVALAGGKPRYDQWVSAAQWTAAGGDLQNPSTATLIKLGRVKSPADVQSLFLFPTIWDLIVWVKPNPAGAFADKNPDVKPSGLHSAM